MRRLPRRPFSTYCSVQQIPLMKRAIPLLTDEEKTAMKEQAQQVLDAVKGGGRAGRCRKGCG